MDNIIAKVQQVRTATSEYAMENAKLFSNYGECMAWLKATEQKSLEHLEHPA